MTPPRRICTDAERLAEYADGRLQQPDCEEVERHLEACPACRDVLTDVTAFAHRERGRVSSPAPDRQRYEQAITSLASDERLVFYGRFEELLSFEHLGRALDISPTAARDLFASAVMKLRVQLARV